MPFDFNPTEEIKTVGLCQLQRIHFQFIELRLKKQFHHAILVYSKPFDWHVWQHSNNGI